MRLRASLLGVALVAAGLIVGFYFTRLLHTTPDVIQSSAGTSASGAPTADVTMTTVGSAGVGVHANWVAYLNSDGQPDTYFKVPAHATVHMTINQQDSGTGLRNEWLGLVRGVSTTGPDGNTVQNAFSLKTYNKKQYVVQAVGITYNADGSQSASLSLAGGGSTPPDDGTLIPGHTFTIPDIGVSVPLPGVANADGSQTNVITFDFTAPGPGIYRWQCFVPCGAGTLYGNGGPMQTLGYMAGEMIVQ